MKNSKTNIYIKYNDKIYKFLKLWTESDGSFYVELLHTRRTNQQKKIHYEVGNTSETLYTRIIEEHDSDINANPIRISYHTSGMIKYHGLERNVIFQEPLTNVTLINTYFMYSIPSLSSLDEKKGLENSLLNLIDIEEVFDKRLNFYFSIFPPEFVEFEKMSNVFFNVKVLDLFSFVVTFEIDEQIFNFGSTVPESTFLFFSPRDGVLQKQALSKSEAYLKFQQKIYETDELIVFPPNGEGVFKMLYAVEMRIPPMVKIEFSNESYEIRDVAKTTVKTTFKIYDNKKSRYIKNAHDVQITAISLDAEIYPDDYVFPKGYI